MTPEYLLRRSAYGVDRWTARSVLQGYLDGMATPCAAGSYEACIAAIGLISGRRPVVTTLAGWRESWLVMVEAQGFVRLIKQTPRTILVAIDAPGPMPAHLAAWWIR